MTALNTQLIQWADGIEFEVDFWRDWFATKGGQWPDEYSSRMNPDAPLNGLVRSKLLGLGRKALVLDVGAGPISVVGYNDPDIDFELTPADPLAPIYQRFYKDFDATPPVPTVFGPAEELSVLFAGTQFDLVHCRNALDHSFDPIRGLEEMLRVTKVGGDVLLLHHRNEAENGNYDGFHQYNFDVIDGQFVVWNQVDKFVPEKIFAKNATFRQKLESEYVTVEIKKTAEFPDTDSFERTAKRLGSVWEAVVEALTHRALNKKPTPGT